jgi:hypothetical protein
MRTAKLLVVGLLAVATLTACARRPDPQAMRAQVEAVDFSAATTPLIVAEFSNLGAVGILEKAGRNGTVTSWRSGDGVGFSMDRGVLVRTVGNGLSLKISDATPTLAALSGGGGNVYQRLYKHLTPDNQIAETLFTCEMARPVSETTRLVGRSVAAAKWVESCSSASQTMQNLYWTQAGRGVIKSSQWIAPGATLLIEVPPDAPR